MDQSPDSTPIDIVLGQLQAPNAVQQVALPGPGTPGMGQGPAAGPGDVTQQAKFVQHPEIPGTLASRKLAKNLLLYCVAFATMYVISLPVFQNFVMSFVPSAVNANGTLSNTGAFFKALFGTGAFVFVQFFFIMG